MKDNIKVSIICVTYNQEKYIRKTLDSFLMQETDFDYEIIVHDDASTDETKKIIEDYIRKYPEKIKAIFEKENIYSQDKSVFAVTVKEAKGEYIAVCDGDDFWTNKYKLQKQYDVLEKYKNCSCCVHKVATCDEEEHVLEKVKPSSKYGLNKDTLLTQDEFAKLLFSKASTKCPFQTSSYFFRKSVLDNADNFNWSIERRKYVDANKLKIFLLTGDIFYINEIMSTYRIWAINSLSYKSKTNSDYLGFEMYNLIKEDLEFDKYTNYKYHEYINVEFYRYLLFSNEININKERNKELLKIHKLNILEMIRSVGIKRILVYIFKKINNISK